MRLVDERFATETETVKIETAKIQKENLAFGFGSSPRAMSSRRADQHEQSLAGLAEGTECETLYWACHSGNLSTYLGCVVLAARLIDETAVVEMMMNRDGFCAAFPPASHPKRSAAAPRDSHRHSCLTMYSRPKLLLQARSTSSYPGV